MHVSCQKWPAFLFPEQESYKATACPFLLRRACYIDSVNTIRIDVIPHTLYFFGVSLPRWTHLTVLIRSQRVMKAGLVC